MLRVSASATLTPSNPPCHCLLICCCYSKQEVKQQPPATARRERNPSQAERAKGPGNQSCGSESHRNRQLQLWRPAIAVRAGAATCRNDSANVAACACGQQHRKQLQLSGAQEWSGGRCRDALGASSSRQQLAQWRRQAEDDDGNWQHGRYRLLRA